MDTNLSRKNAQRETKNKCNNYMKEKVKTIEHLHVFPFYPLLEKILYLKKKKPFILLLCP